MKFKTAILILFCFTFSIVNAQEQKPSPQVYMPQPAQLNVFAMGNAKLVNGIAEVKFDTASVFMAKKSTLKVMITANGSWSGIYVTKVTKYGFTVKSETGDLNATFNWVLVGERKIMYPNGWKSTDAE